MAAVLSRARTSDQGEYPNALRTATAKKYESPASRSRSGTSEQRGLSGLLVPHRCKPVKVFRRGNCEMNLDDM